MQGPCFELESVSGRFRTDRTSRKVPAAAPLRSEDAARYIAERSGDLAAMAREMKLDLVAYLLDIAQMEAARTAGSVKSDPA